MALATDVLENDYRPGLAMGRGQYQPARWTEGEDPPLKEREDPLKAATDIDAEVAGNPLPVVSIYGVGGAGKTRLLRETRQRLYQLDRNYLVAWLQLSPRRQVTAVEALVRLYHEWQSAENLDAFEIALALLQAKAGVDPRDVLRELKATSRSRVGKKMVEVMADYADAIGPWPGPLVSALVDLVPEVSFESRFDRKAEKLGISRLRSQDDSGLESSAFSLLGAALAAEERPSFLLIDDADPPLRNDHQMWLRDLVRALPRTRVVIATSDPLTWGKVDGYWRDRVSTELKLGHLSETAADQLLQDLRVDDEQYRNTHIQDHPITRSRRARSDGSGEYTPDHLLPAYLEAAAQAFRAKNFDLFDLKDVHTLALRHVPTNTVQHLGVLTVADLFDESLYDYFTEQDRERMPFKRLKKLSFVERFRSNLYQIHPIVADAILQRLIERDELQEHHKNLHSYWVERLKVSGNDAMALREVALHGLASGAIMAGDAQPHVDAIARTGGAQALRSFAVDLETVAERLRRMDEDDELAERLGRLATTLALESRAAAGDTRELRNGLPSAPQNPPQDELEARLWIAAGDLLRISGEKPSEALGFYQAIYGYDDTPASIRAGHWVADLQMATGDFAASARTAEQLRSQVSPSDARAVAWIDRVQHLAARFSFDLVASKKYLDSAVNAMPVDAERLLELELDVNRIELASFEAAGVMPDHIDEVVSALEHFGALQELGKAQTAIALHHATCGDFEAANVASKMAIDALETCQYKSGLARAHLVAAVILGKELASKGEWHKLDRCANLAAKAVAALAEAEVYPTLVITASHLLDRLGHPTTELRSAAETARAGVRLVDSQPSLDERVSGFLGRVLRDDLDQRVADAGTGAPLEGNYNKNVRNGSELIRFRKTRPDLMDLMIWDEGAVLSAVWRRRLPVPRPIAFCHHPEAAIHEWIDGSLLEKMSPKREAIGMDLTRKLIDFIVSLGQVKLSELPNLPENWPTGEDTRSFANIVLEFTREIHARHISGFGALWDMLGIPSDPFATVDFDALSPRRLQLIHCDVHRKNVIVRHDGEPVFLDWELALWGDPLYDLAVHLHKMQYSVQDDETARTRWWSSGPSNTPWMDDLDMYLRHERFKSAIVDSVRTAKRWTEAQDKVAELIELHAKLEPAFRHWGQTQVPDLDTLEAILNTFVSSE